MKLHIVSTMVTMLLLAACGREQTNSDGNGPGNADGAGGRRDPPTAPATETGEPTSSQTDSASTDSASTPWSQPSRE